MAVTNSNLRAWFYSSISYGQVGGGCFEETFDEKRDRHLNVKHMNVYSLSVIFFFEAALKRRLRATEAEIKLLMSRHSLKRTWQYMVVVDNGPENNSLGNACLTLNSQ